jgi:hypothetical protein
VTELLDNACIFGYVFTIRRHGDMSQVVVSKDGGQKATLCGAPDRVSEVLEKAARAALEMEIDGKSIGS